MDDSHEETLDPTDWTGARAVALPAVDDAIAHLVGLRERPAWRQPPPEVRAFFAGPLPRKPAALAQVYDEVAQYVRPYPMGNIHPRFWAWFMGAGISPERWPTSWPL
jgi:hypothetical protein